MNQSTINHEEVQKFAQHANQWWDKEGPLKTLHDINPLRLQFIQQHVSLDVCELLDVGCGGGILCEALAQAGARVTGIDAAAEAIAIAQTHAQTSNLSINYHCTPIEHFNESTYQVVTCMEMLEHIEHPEMVFEHSARLLKPHGVFFVSTISRTFKAYAEVILAAEYLLGLLPRQTHDYKKFIQPSELMRLARRYDFELIDLKGMSYNPITRGASLTADVTVNYLMALQKKS